MNNNYKCRELPGLKTGKETTTDEVECWTLAVTADSRNILCGSGIDGKGKVLVFNMESDLLVSSMETSGKIPLSLAVSSDGK